MYLQHVPLRDTVGEQGRAMHQTCHVARSPFLEAVDHAFEDLEEIGAQTEKQDEYLSKLKII